MKLVKNISGIDLDFDGIAIHPNGVAQVPDGLEHPDLVEVTAESEVQEEKPKRKRTLIEKITGKGRSTNAKKGK